MTEKQNDENSTVPDDCAAVIFHPDGMLSVRMPNAEDEDLVPAHVQMAVAVLCALEDDNIRVLMIELMKKKLAEGAAVVDDDGG